MLYAILNQMLALGRHSSTFARAIGATREVWRCATASVCQRSTRINSRASSNDGESYRGVNNDQAPLPSRRVAGSDLRR